MNYTVDDLKRIYAESLNNELSYKELKDIKKELTLLCQITEFDSFALEDIICTLLYFKKLNILDKINNESISLLRQITFGNKEETYSDSNTIFLNKYLRDLLLPFNYNHCDKEYNILYFLSETDTFINLIRNNCQRDGFITLKKYNSHLYEIAIRYYQIMEELEASNYYILGGLKDRIIFASTLSHLASLLYLSLDEYDYDYDLLIRTWNNIIENFIDYLITCEDYKIYQDLSPSENELKNEYELSLKLLRQTHNPPIKIKRS